MKGKKKCYVYVLIGPLLGKIIGNAQDAPFELNAEMGNRSSLQAYQLKPSQGRPTSASENE
jgi:hypothetical protein